MSTMVYADEVVPVDSIEELDGLDDDRRQSDKEVKMAEALVESLSADFDPSKYHDDYREQVLDLIETQGRRRGVRGCPSRRPRRRRSST